MNGEEEMVNKYHKKSVEVFNENLRDEMRGCRDWGWPCENTSLISDKLISLSKINFNLQTVEMWGHSQTGQWSGFICGLKRFCWSGWSDSSIYSHIDICFNIFKSKTHLASLLPPPLPSVISPPSLLSFVLHILTVCRHGDASCWAWVSPHLPPHLGMARSNIMNMIILNYKAFLSLASPSQLEPFNLLICSS